MLLKKEHINFRFAKPEYLPTVQQLLAQANLPFEDLTKHLSNFLLAIYHGSCIGVAGIELYPPAALLRSFTVSENFRNKGVGQMLYEKMYAFAQERKIQSLYLLTETAERFFRKNLFVVVMREDVPVTIAATDEFKSLCPSSAIVMMKVIH
jgi:amino-acid N-acetyltransferase